MQLIALLQAVPWAGSKKLELTSYVVLGIMAILVLSTILSKYLRIRNAVLGSREFAVKFVTVLRVWDWDAALSVTEDYRQSHLASIIRSGLLERNASINRLPKSLVLNRMAEVMENAVIVHHYEYGRGLGMMDAIASTAPFVGILGGTAYALAVGTALAIPAIWFTHYLRNRVTRLEVEMRSMAHELVFMVDSQIKDEEKGEAGH